MKLRVLVLITAFIISFHSPTQAMSFAFPDQAGYDQLLKQYVVNGDVDYQGLNNDRAELEDYLNRLSKVEEGTFDNWKEADQLAYLINLYNAQTLKLILDHYPVKSIRKIGGLLGSPWDLEVVQLFGKTVTLNFLEHDFIRKHYQDARIHFALVCAAKGCPPLRSEAYVPEKLDHQLDDQAQTFLSQSEKNRVDVKKKRLYLSPIFKWYKKDFLKEAKSLKAYVARFVTQDLREKLTIQKYKVKYTKYDWSLNES